VWRERQDYSANREEVPLKRMPRTRVERSASASADHGGDGDIAACHTLAAVDQASQAIDRQETRCRRGADSTPPPVVAVDQQPKPMPTTAPTAATTV
jgi:hypothetical protein